MTSEEVSMPSPDPSVGEEHVFKPTVVIAIDFGTTFSGYAFSFKSNKEDIKLYNNWGNCVGIQNAFKAPTCILTGEKGNFKAFGYEAQERYCGLSPEEASNYNFYEKFKMHLHNRKLELETKIAATSSGQITKALDIFTKVLSFLRQHALNTIETQTGRCPDANEIQWVVTVPAIWSDASKQFMREAAYKAELTRSRVSSQLVIALEPEAASLYSRESHLYLSRSEESGTKIPKGTQYLVVDCGGGTLDITAHKLNADNTISELTFAHGGDLGGSQVDARFVKLLEEIFSKNMIDKYKMDNKADWQQMMINFEKVKRAFNPNDKEQLTNVPLSYEFIESFHDQTGIQIRTLNHNGVIYRMGKLRIPFDVMYKLYEPVVNGIVDHVRNLLQKPALKEVSLVLLVGGFGESQVLQKALKEAIHPITLVVPSETSLCVMKGAVLCGHSPGNITERVARKTYGCRYFPKYDPSIHSNPQKTKMYDGVKRAVNVFEKWITKGDIVKTDFKHESFFNPAWSSQIDIEIPIFKTDKEDPKYVDEEEIEKVGTLTIDLPGKGLDRKIKYTIAFGNTELEVEAWDPRPNGDKQKCKIDFLSRN